MYLCVFSFFCQSFVSLFSIFTFSVFYLSLSLFPFFHFSVFVLSVLRNNLSSILRPRHRSHTHFLSRTFDKTSRSAKLEHFSERGFGGNGSIQDSGPDIESRVFFLNFKHLNLATTLFSLALNVIIQLKIIPRNMKDM